MTKTIWTSEVQLKNKLLFTWESVHQSQLLYRGEEVEQHLIGWNTGDNLSLADHSALSRSNTGVMSLNSTRVIDVCLRLFCICVILCR
jgi:hypothetical protein